MSRRDELEIAAALRADAASLAARASLPPADAVWWRSRLRARADAARTAERPIAAALGFAAVCVLALAAAAAAAAWHALPDVVVRHALLMAGGVALCLLVAPVAVLAALGD